MIRKQIYLDEKGEAGLKNLALARGVSEAFLMREAVAQYLVSNTPKPKSDRKKKNRRDDNPLWKLLDLPPIPGVPKEVAEKLDDYLYRGFLTRKKCS